jgi:hypothetical protein
MATHEQHDGTTPRSQPDTCAHNAAGPQRMPGRAGETDREETARRRAPMPSEVSEEKVAEIAADAEARASAGR